MTPRTAGPTAFISPAAISAPVGPVVLVALMACGNSLPSGGDAVVRDSAGVTIVEIPAALEDRPLGWTLAEDPDLVIGVAEGEEAYQLFRPTGAFQLPDGRIAIVNTGTQEVRYFDGRGRFLHSAGRRGAGPGEFQAPQVLRPMGAAGELLIWDLMVNRFTLLGPDGEVLRMVTPEAQVRMPSGWDGTGAVLIAQGSAAAGLGTPEGVMANDFTYEVIGLDGGGPVLVAEVPGRIYHAQIGPQIWFRAIPFDSRSSAAAGRGAFYITTGAAAEIRGHASDGRLVRLLRVARDPEPVRRADVDRFVERELEGFREPGLRSEWQSRYARMPVPATMPVYRGLLVDDLGHVWAEHFRIEAADAPAWTVFDPDRGALGTLRTPAGLTIDHIGEDFIIGRLRDELDVDRVVRYALDRTT